MIRAHPFLLPWRRLLVLVPVLFCMSCSSRPKYNPVHGKVLYNNEPLEGVVVTFHPKGNEKMRELPFGITGEDGAFELETGKAEGAPEGEYVVTFYCPQLVEGKPGKKGRPKGMVMQHEQEDRLRGAYANEGKSNFKVSVKSGKNELDPFNLK